MNDDKIDITDNLQQKEYIEKEKAFYSAMVSAWINTRIERDKQLLTLSVTAIGVLVTLLRTIGVSNFTQLLLFSFALLSFLITVISIIYILDRNALHIEKILNENQTQDGILMIVDKIAGFSFSIGIILVVIIGINSAILNLSEKKTSMSQEQHLNKQHQQREEKHSMAGVSKLRPQPPKAPEQPCKPPEKPTQNQGSQNSSGK